MLKHSWRLSRMPGAMVNHIAWHARRVAEAVDQASFHSSRKMENFCFIASADAP